MPILLALGSMICVGILMRILFALSKGTVEPPAATATATTATATAEATSAAASRPNFLVFLLDDLEVDLLDNMLKAGLLPNIQNKIVQGAFDFQNAYVSTPICTPSRATFLTGKYAHNTGTWHVTGQQGPLAFDSYLASTGNAYLPTWLGSGYHRAYIGKTHLGTNYPNWDFFRPVNGYDLRPGMYRARENNVNVYPNMYQTKYIGDSAKEAIRAAGTKPFFLVVAPTAVHVNVFNWRRMDSFTNSHFRGTPVSFNQFFDRADNVWRQQLVTVEYVGVQPVYRWWSRDSRSRDSGWGPWAAIGDASSIAPDTEEGAVVGWNVVTPEPRLKRQQLIKKRGTEVAFYSRDLVAGGSQRWVKAADESTLAGTGSLPLVAWSAVSFPSGLIRQQVVRGSAVDGYVSYVRYRQPFRGSFTPWRLDPDWGESVVFGTLQGFNIIPTTGHHYILQLLFQPPNSSRYEWWQSPELVDHEELAVEQNNGEPIGVGRQLDMNIAEEGELLNQPYLRYTNKRHTLQDTAPTGLEGEAELLSAEAETITVGQVHPYYMMRAYAEGSWSPVLPGQTYDWGGRYPAGSLRANGEIHGFNASAQRYNLPTRKPSYNKKVDCPVPFYSTAAWPNLFNQVWGRRNQEDYLRRLYLDRQEQLLSVDKMVGEVVDAAGPNTIVIFTSDNGHFNGEHRLANKLTPHEESIHVPLYIKMPQGRGRPITHIVGNVDLAPTILDYAGLAWNNSRYNVDGRSLRPLLENTNVTSWRKGLLIEYRRPYGERYSSTDWRFGLPHYLGVRFSPHIEGINANSLYTHYYDQMAVSSTTIATERYLMNSDPHQVRNVSKGNHTVLELFCKRIHAAKGQACRNAEEAHVPIG